MKNLIFLFVFAMIIFSFTDAFAQTIGDVIKPKVESELLNSANNNPGKATVLVYSNTSWSGNISGGISGGSTKSGSGDAKFIVSCGDLGLAQGLIQKDTDYGFVAVVIIQNGEILAVESTNAAYGIAHAVADNCSSGSFSGGGCLIATATFDSELSPQVQKLREIRDSKLLQTESGSAFMESFNSFYYSFSPVIADYERENPVFKEMVKVAITPMITSLSLMDYAETETEVLGIGVSLIILNLGMYVGIPVFAILRIRK